MIRFWHELTPQVLSVAFLVGVLGNLAAAVLCGTPALWHLHRKLDRQHAERLAQSAVHHAAQLTAISAVRAAGEITDKLVADAKGGRTLRRR
jgi:hypothetical protein